MLKCLLPWLKEIQYSNFLPGKFAKIFEIRILLSFVFQTAGISIPLMRQLADRKLNLVEILLDIFRLVITEKKLKEEREASSPGVAEAFLRAAAGDAAAQQVIQSI